MRGQVAVELLVLYSVLLIVFLGLINLYLERVVTNRDRVQTINAQRTGDDLARQINSVYASANGTSSSVLLPQTLEGTVTYGIRIAGNRVELNWTRIVTSPLTTSNVTNCTGALAIIPGNTIKLTNVNGVVCIV